MSPVVFRHRGFKFHFFANEGTPREPAHIHVIKDGTEAKFWLWPDVRVAYNDGFDDRTIEQLLGLVEERRSEITQAWDEFFRDAN